MEKEERKTQNPKIKMNGGENISLNFISWSFILKVFLFKIRIIMNFFKKNYFFLSKNITLNKSPLKY